MKKELKLKSNSVDMAGIKKDYKDSIVEYIWNGFDANATEINIDYKANSLQTITEITIKDNGYGINYENIDDTFGSFLVSEKLVSKTEADNIQGSKGKGRFSFLGFANFCEWDTVYEHEGKLQEFAIEINYNQKNEFEISEKRDCKGVATGTIVKITGISNISEAELKSKDFEEYLLSNFAWYLYLNKNSKIIFNGRQLQYNKVINEDLSETMDVQVGEYEFKVFFINWKIQIRTKYYTYMLDDLDIQKNKIFTRYNNNAVNFVHSVYVKSKYFRDFVPPLKDGIDGQIDFVCEKSDKDKTYKELIDKITEIVSNKSMDFLRLNSKEVIKSLENEGAFPKFSNDRYGEIKKKDLTEVVKEIYCIQPKIFYNKSSLEQKKTLIGFLNLLLDSNERNNIITIVESITNLSSEERESLAKILRKTSLSNIINTVRVLDERKNVIEMLKKLVFENKYTTTERDNIQKIMEKNFWIFGDEYHLITADKNFEKALEEYTYKLYGSKDKEDFKINDKEKLRRMDIFLASSRPLNPYSNSSLKEENVILELKAPRVEINKDIFRQLEDYMTLIIGEDKFNSTLREWKFYAISNSVDDFIKDKYEENKNKGLNFLVKEVRNYKIFVMTWDDVFKSFDAKYRYLYDKLKLEKTGLENELGISTGIINSNVITNQILSAEIS